jgi:leucyl aminopeptidase
VLSAAKRSGEEVWQLPMFDHYAEQLKSDVADVKNTGTRWGGAITAAKFLEKFVDKRPWVHLDIAGPAFAASSKAHREGGGTGALTRTLVEVASAFK